MDQFSLETHKKKVHQKKNTLCTHLSVKLSSTAQAEDMLHVSLRHESNAGIISLVHGFLPVRMTFTTFRIYVFKFHILKLHLQTGLWSYYFPHLVFLLLLLSR